MLYHAGALYRLHEVGLLASLDRISSVSGGSITAGLLAFVWARQGWTGRTVSNDEFRTCFVEPTLELAGHTIDIPSILLGFLPWLNVGREVARRYDRLLFHGATLQDLPDRPRFVFNASNLQSGAVWRFSKPYMADWKVGKVDSPKIPLSWAVAASSAFPPVLSPFELRLKKPQFGKSLYTTLHFPPYTTRPLLSDGGVYDNLGLETVFKRYTTVLVSDGGAPFRSTPHPARFWPFQLKRVIDCIDNQVRSLRVRQLIEAFGTKSRQGAYWGIGTPLSRYPNPGPLPCSTEATAALGAVSTRLAAIDISLRQKLVNWGYVSCAAALESHFPQAGPLPALPFPTATLR